MTEPNLDRRLVKYVGQPAPKYVLPMLGLILVDVTAAVTAIPAMAGMISDRRWLPASVLALSFAAFVACTTVISFVISDKMKDWLAANSPEAAGSGMRRSARIRHASMQSEEAAAAIKEMNELLSGRTGHEPARELSFEAWDYLRQFRKSEGERFKK